MNRLKELRENNSITQQELAEKLGVHYRTIQNWEKDTKTQIKPEKAKMLADYFDVSVGYLLGHSNEMTAYYFVNIAKANLLDALMTAGFIKQYHLEYGLKELDQIDRNILEKDWSDDNDSDN